MADNTNNTEISFDKFLGLEGGGEFVLGESPIEEGMEPLVLETTIPTSTENPKEEEEVIPPAAEVAPVDLQIPNDLKPEVTETNFYSNIVKKFLADGDWEDVSIEDEEGNLVKVSEIENLDEETFLAIKEDQKNVLKENIDKNYISVKDSTEEQRRLLNIIQNGGDLREIFKSEEALKKPFEGMDLTDQNNQASILFWQYTTKQGLGEAEAKLLVDKAIKDLTIDATVGKVVEFYQENHKKQLIEIERKVVEDKKAEEAAIKDYRKNLSTFYKNEGLAESLSKRLVDAATRKDETGNLVIDSVYEQLMSDPQKAKDLIFFMLEQENFLKAKGASIKKDEQIGLMRTIKIVRDTGGKSNKPEIKEEPKAKNPFGDVVLEVE